MKKKSVPRLIVVSIIIIGASCNTPRYIYSPAAHNVPVLTKKGDTKNGCRLLHQRCRPGKEGRCKD